MTERADLIVVGGGIHGCGVAQAAAAAGHEVLLLERTALAAGTSSRSSKLIHGGLRYLEQFEFGLVRECLTERSLLLALAPDLVRLRSFNIPVYSDTSRRPLTVRAGLMLYSLLGGLRPATRFSSLPREQWRNLDGLSTRGLRAVFRYRDAQTDDRLLTRAVMASARSLGAELACPAEFVGAALHGDGVAVRYRLNGTEREASARVLVNAAGPWVQRVLDRVRPAPPRRRVELVRGTHVWLDHELEHGIYYAESPDDRRPVFVMSNGGRTLVGTTEVPFHGDPDRVAPTDEECGYLYRVLERYFPALAALPAADRYAGLRVLPAGREPANRRSRETLLVADRPRRPRLLSIYGGKLTSYRATAEKVLARLGSSLPERRRRALTSRLKLSVPENNDD